MAKSITITAITHPGKVRMRNEDCVVVGSPVAASPDGVPVALVHDLAMPITLFVCDGMGGHNAGDVASSMASRTIADRLTGDADQATIASALQAANKALFDAAAAEPRHVGMGTTVAGIWFSADRAFWFNVGDSRVYRYRNEFIRQLSTDDSSVNRGGLTQCLGGMQDFVEIDPHIGSEPVHEGWRYLLCSDGLTDMVTVEDIERILGQTPYHAAIALLDAAIASGGADNISILVAEIL